MLRTVMLPTDFSDECGLIWSFARGLGSLGVQKVILTNVVEASGMEGPVIGAKADEARDRLEEVAKELTAAGLSVESRVLAGDPFHELLALAHERDVDAIVCGTHGKKVIRQMFQGSISERLLQEGDTPMLLVRYDLLMKAADPASLAADFADSVVMPTDFSGPARRAFDMVMSLPKGTLGRLRLLHVIESIIRPERREKALAGAEFGLENLQDIAERGGVDVSIVVGEGDAKNTILEEVASQEATGVVMGSRGRSPLGEMLLGSASMRLLREAPCPVLVVH